MLIMEIVMMGAVELVGGEIKNLYANKAAARYIGLSQEQVPSLFPFFSKNN